LEDDQQKDLKEKKLTQWSIHLKWPWCGDHRHFYREATWWSAARKKTNKQLH
jgi:hypothetical protein